MRPGSRSPPTTTRFVTLEGVPGLGGDVAPTRRRCTPSSIAKRVAASVFPKFALRANGEDKRRSQIAAPALAEVSLFGPVQWLHPTGARSEPRRSARCVTERIRRLRRAAGVLGPSGTSG